MKKPLLALAALCLCQCTTVTERTTQSVDAAAFTAGANAVTAIAAPRARVVAEK